ncbi:MAG: hypothetical protein ACMG6H_03120, partial [Acidobacteriota bacterium]
MAHGLLPSLAIEKVLGTARVFGAHSGQTCRRSQAAAEKTLKQRMQAVFFAATVAGYRHKNVAA